MPRPDKSARDDILRQPGSTRWLSTSARLLCHAVALMACLAYAADPVIDAARQNDIEFQRQRDAEQRLRQQMETSPSVHLPTASDEYANARLPDEQPCFVVGELELDVQPAQFSPQFDWLKAAAGQTGDGQEDALIGRCLGGRGINIVMRRLQNALIERGYVTSRVGAPAQDISGGQLVLTIVAGRVRSISFTAQSDARARATNALPLVAGSLLNIRDLEQGLENFKRLPTADADIQIVPADGADGQAGESDVLIDWRQTFPLRLMLTADNSGTEATGLYQGGATLSGEHLLTLNDLFYVNLTQGVGNGPQDVRGTRGATVHYSLPFDYWLLSATASNSAYHQTVIGSTQNYVYRGESDTAEARIARVFRRQATGKSIAWGRLWTRNSKNFIDDTEVVVQRRKTSGWELGLSHFQNIGRAALEANVSYRRGSWLFGAQPAPEEAFGEGTSLFGLYAYDLRVVVPFELADQRLRWIGSLRGQANVTTLTPQDRFYIGGRGSVRAYDSEHLLAGEGGVAWRNDLGWLIGKQEAYLGIDQGQVSGPSTSYLPTKRLSGAVVGLRGSWNSFAYDVFLGMPINRPERFNAPGHLVGFNLSYELRD